MQFSALVSLTALAAAASTNAQAGWQASWFGPWPGHPEWHDAMNEGKPNASGEPMTTPGIALYDRETLGKWFVVWGPGGKEYVLPQVDIGPAPWTGKKIDINAPAAAQMGYTPQTFPTGAEFPYRLATHTEIASAKADPGEAPVKKTEPALHVWHSQDGSPELVEPHRWYEAASFISNHQPKETPPNE